ncbi:MAG: DUF3047 domain-containing protein [Geminicoccaceae bacterium]
MTMRLSAGLCLVACTPVVDVGADAAVSERALFEAGITPIDAFRHVRLRGETRYDTVDIDGMPAIEARPMASASGLVLPVDIDLATCMGLRWAWRVDDLQPSADLRARTGDDVAAGLFVLFGVPGALTPPEDVPILRYVWSGGSEAPGSIIANPYQPEAVRNVVIRSGDVGLGTWQIEERDIAADFEAAFGHAPVRSIEAIALFSDNDQTREPTLAYFGWAKSVCTG